MKNNLVEVIYDEKKGRCVIAKEKIRKGTAILRDHIIVAEFNDHIEKTEFTRYVFEWDAKTVVLALGLSSLINHSKFSNVHWNPLYECYMIEMVADRTIERGEELVFDYGNTIGFTAELPIKI